MNLPTPECEEGFTYRQLSEILGSRLPEFQRWMKGQTGAICEGRLYDYKAARYRPCCGGVAHGMVVYAHDVERFLAARPVID